LSHEKPHIPQTNPVLHFVAIANVLLLHGAADAVAHGLNAFFQIIILSLSLPENS
jgi:hypothetical protein